MATNYIYKFKVSEIDCKLGGAGFVYLTVMMIGGGV
jgi:hypothetical protein